MRLVSCIYLEVFVLLCFLCPSSYSGGYQEVSLNVGKYRALADVYTEAADRIDGSKGSEPVFRHVDKKEHYCSILADLLLSSETVSEEYKLHDPGLDSTETLELRLFAQSLRNYIDIATSLMRETDFSLRYMWNVNCWSQFNLTKFFSDDQYQHYVVSTTPDRKKLRILGHIKTGLYGVVARRLRIHSSIESVELISFGGSVYEAIKIGELIRKRKLNTVLTSNCFSACTLIFLAGAERLVPAPYYSLGFHRVTSRDWPVPANDEVYSTIKDYADRMAGNGNEIVQAHLSGEEFDYFMFDRRQLCAHRVASYVEGVCSTDAHSD